MIGKACCTPAIDGAFGSRSMQRERMGDAMLKEVEYWGFGVADRGSRPQARSHPLAFRVQHDNEKTKEPECKQP